MAVAIIVGGHIVNTLSYDALFITLGTAQVIATLYLLPMLRRSP